MREKYKNHFSKLTCMVALFLFGMQASLLAQISYPPEEFEVEIQLPPRTTPDQMSLAAAGNLYIGDYSRVKGITANMNSEETFLGLKTESGGVQSTGSVIIGGGSHILGDVLTAGYVEMGGDVTVDGVIKEKDYLKSGQPFIGEP